MHFFYFCNLFFRVLVDSFVITPINRTVRYVTANVHAKLKIITQHYRMKCYRERVEGKGDEDRGGAGGKLLKHAGMKDPTVL